MGAKGQPSRQRPQYKLTAPEQLVITLAGRLACSARQDRNRPDGARRREEMNGAARLGRPDRCWNTVAVRGESLVNRRNLPSVRRFRHKEGCGRLLQVA